MTMKIDKKTREQAARILAVQASTPDMQGMPHLTAIHLGVAGRAAVHLAVDAWIASPFGSGNWYADAESMVRTGWSPS